MTEIGSSHWLFLPPLPGFCLVECVEQQPQLGGVQKVHFGVCGEGGIAISGKNGLELADERREPGWIAGLKVVQLLDRMVLDVFLDCQGDHGEEGKLTALAVTAVAAIGEVGLNRVDPRGLCVLGVAGGAFQPTQEFPTGPRLGCVAVRLIAFDRPLKRLSCLLVASKDEERRGEATSCSPLVGEVSRSRKNFCGSPGERNSFLRPPHFAVKDA